MDVKTDGAGGLRNLKTGRMDCELCNHPGCDGEVYWDLFRSCEMCHKHMCVVHLVSLGDGVVCWQCAEKVATAMIAKLWGGSEVYKKAKEIMEKEKMRELPTPDFKAACEMDDARQQEAKELRERWFKEYEVVGAPMKAEDLRKRSEAIREAKRRAIVCDEPKVLCTPLAEEMHRRLHEVGPLDDALDRGPTSISDGIDLEREADKLEFYISPEVQAEAEMLRDVAQPYLNRALLIQATMDELDKAVKACDEGPGADIPLTDDEVEYAWKWCKGTLSRVVVAPLKTFKRLLLTIARGKKENDILSTEAEGCREEIRAREMDLALGTQTLTSYVDRIRDFLENQLNQPMSMRAGVVLHMRGMVVPMADTELGEVRRCCNLHDVRFVVLPIKTARRLLATIDELSTSLIAVLERSEKSLASSEKFLSDVETSVDGIIEGLDGILEDVVHSLVDNIPTEEDRAVCGSEAAKLTPCIKQVTCLECLRMRALGIEG